jgi:hypothetical protein
MKLKTSLGTGSGAHPDANFSPVKIPLDAAGFIPHGPASTAGYSGYLWNTVRKEPCLLPVIYGGRRKKASAEANFRLQIFDFRLNTLTRHEVQIFNLRSEILRSQPSAR